MNAGQLKRILEDVPDEAIVFVAINHVYEELDSIEPTDDLSEINLLGESHRDQ